MEKQSVDTPDEGTPDQLRSIFRREFLELTQALKVSANMLSS